MRSSMGMQDSIELKKLFLTSVVRRKTMALDKSDVDHCDAEVSTIREDHLMHILRIRFLLFLFPIFKKVRRK